MSDIHDLSASSSPADLPADCSAAARRFLQAHRAGGWTLRLKQSVNQLFPEAAAETAVRISNNDHGPARAAFLLRDLNDVTIDGCGTRLTVRGTPLSGRGRIKLPYTPLIPFILDACSNVSLRNLSIDWQTPFIAQGVVTDSRPRSIVVRPDTPLRWWTWNGHLYFEGEGWTFPVQRLLAADARTGAMLRDTGDNMGSGYETNWAYEPAADGHVRISGPLERMPPPGAAVFFWLADFDTGGRRSPAVFINECRGVTLENVTIHHSWGMGIIAQRSSDLALRSVVVEPSTGRLFTLTADATHFVGCRGSLTIEQCRFQNQFDDAVNIHGLYLQVVRVLDSRTARVRRGHPQHEGVKAMEAGDRIEWLRRAELAVLGSARVTAVADLNAETMDITVDADIPASLPPGDIAENADWHPDVTIRDCTMRWNRARGALLNGRGRILVQGCRFENPGAAILIETSADWFESGRVSEVTITGNEFVDCGHCRPWGSSVIHAVPALEQPARRTTPFHGTITVKDNSFRKLNGPAVTARWVERLAVDDNRFAEVPDGVTLVERTDCG